MQSLLPGCVSQNSSGVKPSPDFVTNQPILGEVWAQTLLCNAPLGCISQNDFGGQTSPKIGYFVTHVVESFTPKSCCETQPSL